MLIPILLTTLFTIPHWWKKEDTTTKRILTFPLLLTQFWPQFQVIKVLKLVIQGDSQWKVEKKKLEREISSLGKLLEIMSVVGCPGWCGMVVQALDSKIQ